MKRRLVSTVLALALASGLVEATPAAAQPVRPGHAVAAFEPAERGSDWFTNESLDLRGTGRLAVGVVGDYAYRPLIGKYNADDGSVAAATLRNQLTLHAGVALNLFDRLRLGVSVPLQVFADGHSTVVGGYGYLPPQRTSSVGDVRASLDFGLAGTYGSPFHLAIGGSLWAPTGQRRQLNGDEAVRVGPHLTIAGDAGPFAYAVRSAFVYRDIQEDYQAVRLGSLWTWGGAAGIRFAGRRVLVGPELHGQTITNDHFLRKDATPIEVLLGAHVALRPGVRINAGAGTLLVHGYGAAPARALLGLEFFPDIAAPRPRVLPAAPISAPPPPADRDGDGVVDPEDACPDDAGVRTTEAATNGCPPDGDHDGVLDREDACPTDPGVRTADPKTSGCPKDGDGDGVLDREDACPTEPGVRTGDPKTNGCPDPDRDKDGIENAADACPDAAGPRTSDPKTNGCPRAFVKNDRIQILEQPRFDIGKATLKRESDTLLADVAKVLADHPEIQKVRVEGHTDSVGNPALNKKLSEQRAAAVVSWLVAHGVAASRLAAIGYGKDRPMVANDTEANRALNRRVELHIEAP